METQTLAAEKRSGTGKGAARQLRLRDKVPGVFYGPETSPTSVAVSPKELIRVLSTDLGRNALIKLDFEGSEILTMVRELQVHPVTRSVVHVDFYKVDVSRPVSTRVRFVTTGRAKGVVEGGTLNVVFRELPVRATPDKIPVSIDVDITNLELHDGLAVKDLSLPEGVVVQLDPARNLVSVVTTRKEVDPDEEAKAAEAAAAPEGGASSPGTEDAPKKD
jgi:large subunit ribosomal protein L25